MQGGDAGRHAAAQVCQHLALQAQELEATALPALDALTTKVDTQSLERVRRVKTRLVRRKTRVGAVLTPPSPPLQFHAGACECMCAQQNDLAPVSISSITEVCLEKRIARETATGDFTSRCGVYTLTHSSAA